MYNDKKDMGHLISSDGTLWLDELANQPLTSHSILSYVEFLAFIHEILNYFFIFAVRTAWLLLID